MWLLLPQAMKPVWEGKKKMGGLCISLFETLLPGAISEPSLIPKNSLKTESSGSLLLIFIHCCADFERLIAMSPLAVPPANIGPCSLP